METDRFNSNYFSIKCYMSNFCFIKTKQIEDFLDIPYHIYFILAEKKAEFVPGTVMVNNRGVSCQIFKGGERVYVKNALAVELDGGLITQITFSFSRDLSVITIRYYKNFVPQPSFELTANEVYKASGLCEKVDCDVLYIGQSFGKDGKRTAAQRLSNHKTLQKILSDIACSGLDADITCLLLDFNLDTMLIIPSKTPPEIVEAKYLSFMESLGRFTKRHCIDVAEAGLINFFKPQYNDVYKGNVYRKGLKSKFAFLYSNKVDKIQIEICPELNKRSVINGINMTVPDFLFRTATNELDTKNIGQVIECDLNSNRLLKTELVYYGSDQSSLTVKE